MSLPPNQILRRINIPTHPSIRIHAIKGQGTKHPTHPQAAYTPPLRPGLVNDPQQRPRTIDTHQILIERFRIAATQDTTVILCAQRSGQETTQNIRDTRAIHRHDYHPRIRGAPRADRPASIPARGPPPGGSSRVRITPGGRLTPGGTTATRPAPATSLSAQHTRSMSLDPPNTRSGLETPPKRSPPPPPTTIPAISAREKNTPDVGASHDPTPLTPKARKSAHPRAASPHRP